MEFVGMIVDRLGTRPAPSKIDAITQLPRPNTVEEVRVLLHDRILTAIRTPV